MKILVSDHELSMALSSMGMAYEDMALIVSQRARIEEAGINTANRWACFIGQCAHESLGFTVTEENLNYRAKTMVRVWPSRFKSLQSAEPFARDPRALANKVYGGRMGNDEPGDGYLFRGRGYIQLTGKNNYIKASSFVKLDLEGNPDIVKTDPLLALLTAVWYFTKTKYKGKSILQWCDTLSHKAITKAINGGQHGLMDRVHLSKETLGILSSDEGIFKLPVVRQGSRGKDVKMLQRYLRATGCKIYKIDGIYGKGTAKAVKAFQSANGLVVDGIVGGNTFRMLAEQTMLQE